MRGWSIIYIYVEINCPFLKFVKFLWISQIASHLQFPVRFPSVSLRCGWPICQLLQLCSWHYSMLLYSSDPFFVNYTRCKLLYEPRHPVFSFVVTTKALSLVNWHHPVVSLLIQWPCYLTRDQCSLLQNIRSLSMWVDNITYTCFLPQSNCKWII